jgi:hypothetical protein
LFSNLDESLDIAAAKEDENYKEIDRLVGNGFFVQTASKVQAAVVMYTAMYRDNNGEGRSTNGHGLLVGGDKMLTAGHVFNGLLRRGVECEAIVFHTTRGTFRGVPYRWLIQPGADVLVLCCKELTKAGSWPVLDNFFPDNEDFDEQNCDTSLYSFVHLMKLGGSFVPHSAPASIGGVVQDPFMGTASLCGFGAAAKGYSGCPLVRFLPQGPMVVGILSLSNNTENTLARTEVWCPITTHDSLAKLVETSFLAIPEYVDNGFGNANDYADEPETLNEYVAWTQETPRGIQNAETWRESWPESNPQPIFQCDNVFRNQSSRLVPTIFHGAFFKDSLDAWEAGSMHIPKLQGPPGKRDEPFLKNAKKMADVCHQIPPRLLRRAQRRIIARLSEHLEGGYPLRTWRFATRGGSVAGVEPIEMSTSAGHPYRTSGWRGPREKSELFVGPDGKKEPGPLLRTQIFNFLRDIMDGTFDPKDHPFIDTLKDETRPMNDEGVIKDARVFQVGGLVPNLGLRLCYGDFIGDVKLHHHTLPIKIGINAHDDEAWTRLARFLRMHVEKRKSHNPVENPQEDVPTYIAGDFSNFDKMLSAQLLRAAFAIMDHFYAEWRREARGDIYPEDRLAWQLDAAMRKALQDWVINSVHLSQGFAYTTDHGNPSGNVCTTILNSLCNWLLTECCLNTLAPEAEEESAARGDEVIQGVKYESANFGDDVVIYNGGDKRINQHSMAEQFSKWNIKFTSAQKTQAAEPLLMSHQVEFLKRSFVRCGHMFVGPLRLESIENMMYFCQKKHFANPEVMSQLLRSFATELAFYNEKLYDSYMAKLRMCLNDYNSSQFAQPSLRRIRLPSWAEAWSWREGEAKKGATFIA